MSNITDNIKTGQELMDIYNEQSSSGMSVVYTEHDDSHTDIPDYDDVSW